MQLCCYSRVCLRSIPLELYSVLYTPRATLPFDVIAAEQRQPQTGVSRSDTLHVVGRCCLLTSLLGGGSFISVRMFVRYWERLEAILCVLCFACVYILSRCSSVAQVRRGEDEQFKSIESEDLSCLMHFIGFVHRDSSPKDEPFQLMS